MRKKAFLVLLLLCFSGVTFGQIRSNSDGLVKVLKRVSLGVKGGVNICKTVYTDLNIKIDENDFVPKYAFGAYIEIPMRRFLSISPEFMYIQRGAKLHYNYAGVFPSEYQITARFIDVRVPFQFYYPITNFFKPYAYIAPDFGYVLGGHIDEKRTGLDESHIDIGKANYRSFDLSVLVGIGTRFDINLGQTYMFVKIEAGYNHGFMDTFSDMEKAESSTPANVNAFNNTGRRYNRGIEVMLSIGIPLYLKESSCSEFQRVVRW